MFRRIEPHFYECEACRGTGRVPYGGAMRCTECGGRGWFPIEYSGDVGTIGDLAYSLLGGRESDR